MLVDLDTVIICYIGMYLLVKLGFFVAGRKRIESLSRIEIIRFLFGLYIAIVLGITVFPIEFPLMQMDAGYAEYVNMQLFSFLREGWSTSFIRQVGGNLLIFVPLYPLAVWSGMPEKRWPQALVRIAGCSFLIELVQFLENVIGLTGFFGRISDVNDIFLNTLGGMMGFGAVYLYQKSRRR